MMQDAAHGIRKQKQRTRKVKGVVSPPAGAAQSFYDGRGHAALWTEGPRNRFELRPAIRTRYRPAALKDSGIAKDTRLRKNKIQDRVDHDVLSSTQRAALLYFEYGWFFKIHIAR